MSNAEKMPLIALNEIVMFPHTTLSFEVSGTKTIEIVQSAYEHKQAVFMASRRETDRRDKTENIHDIGTISLIKKVFPLGKNSAQVVSQGVAKGKAISIFLDDEFYHANVIELERSGYVHNEALEGLMLAIKGEFKKYVAAGARVLPENIKMIESTSDPIRLADMVSSNLAVEYEVKQRLLEMTDLDEKLEKVLEILMDRTKALEYQKDILKKTREKIDQSQKEYYLREQAKAIDEELGKASEGGEEIEDYLNRAKELNLPEAPMKRLNKELDRLKKINTYTQEGVIIRDYIDWLLEVPWSEKTEENPDLHIAEKILDDEHYGLDKVKERIMEFLAVKQNTDNLDSPVICLVGPPGVGKTSIAKSIAHALNRKYARMSLGGIRDEAEIRGHRRTYVGSMPGRIISIMSQVKTTNPLILLDEIDKIGNDYKGDPASALLEVLDGEQNFSFRDNYLEVPYDLSDVFFVCTANTLDTVPPALKDRLEVIELSSYTVNEKEHIANDFLIKKQMEKNGVTDLQITNEAISDIIRFYTREAGVRELERQIATICRKSVKEKLMDGKENIIVDSHNLEDYLGIRKYKEKIREDINEIGISTGLAWTSMGGTTLLIESISMKGKGKLQLTGNLGEVMKESAMIAIGYIRANADLFKLDPKFYEKKDIHIHIPAGATPKDGPSAGITLCCSILSALTGKKVKSNVAMTGEMTLVGKVLPVGGIKEKILGAKLFGIDTIILPVDNEPELAEIEEEIKEGMNFKFVDNIKEVIEIAFFDSDFSTKEKLLRIGGDCHDNR